MNNTLVEYKEKSYIFFCLGTSNYGIDAKDVLEIIQLVELEYPESMPDFIAGLLEYNNKIIKIIDIRNILKLQTSKYELNGKIVILKTDTETFGIIIDSVRQIKRINQGGFNSLPYDTQKSYLEAIYTNGDFSATILNIANIEKILNSPEYKIKCGAVSAANYLPTDIKSKEILHRRKLHYSKKRHEVNYEIIKGQDTYITFILAKNTCCIKILDVIGFYRLAGLKIIKVPCTPDFIKGIVSIKGQYITVIDLLTYTENKKTEINADTKIIVIEYEDCQLGFLTDTIGETIEVEEKLIKNNGEKLNSCLIECVIGGNLYSFLDIKRLFEDEKLYVS